MTTDECSFHRVTTNIFLLSDEVLSLLYFSFFRLLVLNCCTFDLFYIFPIWQKVKIYCLIYVHLSITSNLAGTFKPSPVESLYIDYQESTLQLTLQLYNKFKPCPTNTSYNNIFQPKYKHLFVQKEKRINFGPLNGTHTQRIRNFSHKYA